MSDRGKAEATDVWTYSDGVSGYGEGDSPAAAAQDFRDKLIAERNKLNLRLRAVEASLIARTIPIPEPAFGTVAEYDAWVAHMSARSPSRTERGAG